MRCIELRYCRQYSQNARQDDGYQTTLITTAQNLYAQYVANPKKYQQLVLGMAQCGIIAHCAVQRWKTKGRSKSMGKKYIIELPENTHWIQWIMEGTKDHHPYMDFKQVEDLTSYTEPGLEQVRKEAYAEGYKEGMQLSIDDAKLKEEYQQGLNDAWEAVGKIYNMCSDVRHKIFKENLIRKILSDYTASEAIEKIRQYEQEREEIKIGDEVERILDGEVDSKAVFLEENKGYYHCLFWTGCCFTTLGYPKKQFRKTGRHFPEIAAVLEKMRGEQE